MSAGGLADQLGPRFEESVGRTELQDGDRVGIIGGGPAGSFSSYFLLELAARAGIDLDVDVYEPRDYNRPGPVSCNHCGGIVSESLVQLMAMDGIRLPSSVIQRGIDSDVLHTNEGEVRIDTPLLEKRIGAVHRGAGPRGSQGTDWGSFDGFLQSMSREKGANIIPSRVGGLSREEGYPVVTTSDGASARYDLLVGAIGVNTNALRLFEGAGFGYRRPGVTRTYICELPLGAEMVDACAGNSMHVFLLDLPRLEFAALIPKGEYLTVCLLGESVDDQLVHEFLSSAPVRSCLPDGYEIPDRICHCAPLINMVGAREPFADRVVLVGDSAVTRLYKDGIGAAFRTSKAAMTTAVFEGVSAGDFRRSYQPFLDDITKDNTIGKGIFTGSKVVQQMSLGRSVILRSVAAEQRIEGAERHLSTILWDMFTGSAPYRDVLSRCLKPALALRLVRSLFLELVAIYSRMIHEAASGPLVKPVGADPAT